MRENNLLTLAGMKFKGGGYTKEAVVNRCGVRTRFFRIGVTNGRHDGLYNFEQVTEKVDADQV